MTFKPGKSGNPKGRPQGSKHKATLAAQELLDGEGKATTRKCIDLAKKGNVVALRLCLERLVPIRKDRPITLRLPNVSGVEDIPKILEAILRAVAQGKITPVEGQNMTAVIEAYRKGVELSEIEARLTALEAREKRD